MLEEHSFDAGSVLLNYTEGPPSGLPMVLLHGGMSSWQSFLPVIPALISRWHVWAPDARGHGKSGRTSGGEYRFLDNAQDTMTFLRQLVPEPAVLWGQSMGALTAIAVAAEAPEAVRAIVLEDVPLDFHRSMKDVREFLEYMAPLAGTDLTLEEMQRAVADMPIRLPGQEEPVRGGELMDPCTIRLTAESLIQTDRGIYDSLLNGRAIEGYDTDALLQQVSCPTLLLRADPEHGGRLAEEAAARGVALLARGAVQYFPGAGHSIHRSQPEAALEAVTRFLESCDTGLTLDTWRTEWQSRL